MADWRFHKRIFVEGTIVVKVFILFSLVSLSGCKKSARSNSEEESRKVYSSDVIPFFNHWNLILGDGQNVGHAIDFENKDFFYTTSDPTGRWVVFKAPNGGNTHGTSNNTRTELAQLKKWSPMSQAKLSATLKVMNVSATGDARVAATHSVVVGQIHSADGHENEPLKIFYKKFPGHKKGSVFWHYEINTEGDNSRRWDFSEAVWGYDFSVVGENENSFPIEPETGIELREEFSYEIEVKEGTMYLSFKSEGHPTKTFTKNLIRSEYTQEDDIPLQTQKLFIPIGQNGLERKNAYAEEGLFFKLGSYNQTNGKSPEVNKLWCSGAQTFDGNIQKQYETGNYSEVWFKEATIEISKDAISNEQYFVKND